MLFVGKLLRPGVAHCGGGILSNYCSFRSQRLWCLALIKFGGIVFICILACFPFPFINKWLMHEEPLGGWWDRIREGNGPKTVWGRAGTGLSKRLCSSCHNFQTLLIFEFLLSPWEKSNFINELLIMNFEKKTKDQNRFWPSLLCPDKGLLEYTAGTTEGPAVRAEMGLETSIEPGIREHGARKKGRTENTATSPRRSWGVEWRDLGIAVR